MSMNSALFLLVLAATSVSARLQFHHKRAVPTVYTSCAKDKTAALTFDDGPYQYIQQISDEFTKAGAKATFFFNGNNYDCIYNDAAIARVRYAYAAGHQIGSHTWSHANLSTLNTAQINDAMYRMEEALERIIGVKPAFMRPPYGDYNNDVKNIASARGQALALWDRDTGDADGNTTSQSEAVYQNAVNQNVKNMVVLNHETQQSTATTVIPFAINLLQSHGYQLVTLADCLGVAPYAGIGTPQQKNSQWTCSGTPDPGQGCVDSQCKTGTPPFTTTAMSTAPTTTSTPAPTPTSTPSGRVIHPGKSVTTCLTVPDNVNGAAVVVAPCNNATSQTWIQEGGRLIVYGNKCLDVPNGSLNNGVKMRIWTCSNGKKSQQFSATASKQITWTNTKQCLDLSGGKLTNGNQVQMWACSNGNPNQVWNIV